MVGMEDHLRDREQEKACAVEAIEGAFSAIEGSRGEPDQWERAFLVQAISWLFRGGYRLAMIDAEIAMTPPEQRSPASNLQSDAFLDRCNMSLLQEALREAVVEPVRTFPAFGPIVCSQTNPPR